MVKSMRQTAPIQSMRWHNVCVRVRGDGSGPPKLLLKDICGAALPGDMVALLGPSGEPVQHHVHACCGHCIDSADWGTLGGNPPFPCEALGSHWSTVGGLHATEHAALEDCWCEALMRACRTLQV